MPVRSREHLAEDCQDDGCRRFPCTLWKRAYAAGAAAGYAEGLAEGAASGYAAGYAEGHSDGAAEASSR